MKLLFLIDGMEAITAGGSERQILQHIRYMREAGESSELCVFRETKWLTENEAGCPITVFDIPRLFSFEGLRKLTKLATWIHRKRFDVVITMSWEANLVGPVLARLARSLAATWII